MSGHFWTLLVPVAVLAAASRLWPPRGGWASMSWTGVTARWFRRGPAHVRAGQAAQHPPRPSLLQPPAVAPQLYAEIARYRADAISFRSVFQQAMGKPDFAYALEAYTIGAMSRLLNLQVDAQEYFWYASMLYWPFDGVEAPGAWTDDLRAHLICRAGICAHLAGREDRAAVLRNWALQQYEAVSASLYEPWKPGGAYENDNYGQLMLLWAYSAVLLGQWDEVDWRCARAVHSYRRSARRRTLLHKENLALARALRALARHQAEPCAARRAEAEQALRKVVKAGRDFVANARACIYVWDLQDAFPDLIGEVLPAPPG